jgi:branched-chain amino acid aminotransferase
MQEVDYIWLNGRMVKWKDAKVHFLVHSLHYGSAVFEGMRCYNTPKGPAIFRLAAHIKRFFDSAKIIRMKIPYSYDEIFAAAKEVVKKNRLKECYIRPLAFFGYGEMGLSTRNCKVEAGIAAWPWGSYLGEEGTKNGIKARVSSYERHFVNSMMTKAKTSGNYVNSSLANREAQECGCDEAIMLDPEGFVSEGSGENIFMVEKGRLLTPPTANALCGITRDSVMEVARDLGITVSEESLTRDRFYIADEVFFTGSAAEVVPVKEIDGITIGSGRPGKITKTLQSALSDIAKGKEPKYEKWLDYV